MGEHLELVIENPCDPDRPASRGAGVGLGNVRARIEALFGHRARVDVEAPAGELSRPPSPARGTGRLSRRPGVAKMTGTAEPGSERMRPMRALIVDDEDLARAVLRELLAAHPEVEIVGEAGNGFAAVKLAEELAPDLLFLDIQMPKLSGFEVMELLGEKVAVIFVTAYDEFALKAFDVHAVDYLLKPVEPARLGEAIGRAAQRLALDQARPSGAHPAFGRRSPRRAPPGRPLERVLIREEGRVHVLPLAKIDFVEAQDDYLSFAVGGKRLQKQQTMGELEAQLDAGRFVRVHRSYLLNVERLARLELYAKDSWIAILADGTRIPVSRTGHARLKELLG